MNDDLFTLEWSKKQNAFHIQAALLTVEKNLNALLGDKSTDYVTLMIGTRDECEVIQKRYRHKLKKEKDSLKSWQVYRKQ